MKEMIDITSEVVKAMKEIEKIGMSKGMPAAIEHLDTFPQYIQDAIKKYLKEHFKK